MAEDEMVIKPTLSYWPSYEVYPTSSPYFKVRRSIYDERLFERCSNDPPCNHPLVTSTFKESLTQLLIEAGRSRSWDYYRFYSKNTGNNTMYKKAIVAAANFATLLVNKDAISQYSNQSQLLSQMKDLWNYASNHGKRGLSSAQAWKKCLSEVERKTNEYSLITEPYLATLIHDYHEAREWFRLRFNQPYFHCSSRSYSRFSLIKKDSGYLEVEDEVRDMTSCLSLTVDEHTTILVMIARGMIEEVVSIFFDLLIPPDSAHVFTRTEEGPGDELGVLLERLAYHFQREIWEDLWLFNSPMVVMGQTWGCYPSAALGEVLEVAELRRRALGRRFISAKIFIWSFLQCGYVLPPLDVPVLDTDSETRHLSQIYPAVIEFVTSLGLETIELEHFIFIVLHLKDLAGANVQHFKEFMEMVDTDTKVRPKLTTRPSTYIPNIIGGLFKLKLCKLKRRKHIGTEETEGTS